MSKDTNPTMQTYKPLYDIIDKLNARFFGNRLPHVLLTLQRQPKVFGYMSINRFVNTKGDTTHELALNPDYFPIYPITEILQTLAHELCHLEQLLNGKPSRSGYHNKEWGNMMEAIGLMPSSTGNVGGKKTGQHMGDYIIKGGVFEKFCAEILDSDFKIEWFDRFPPRHESPKEGSFMYQAGSAVMNSNHSVSGDFNIINISNYEDHGSDESDSDAVTFPFANEFEGHEVSDNLSEIVTGMYQPTVKTPTRYKFTCPNCSANLWGKPSLKVLCVDCDVQFEVQGYAPKEEE